MQIDISSTLDKGYQQHQRGNFAAAIEFYDQVLSVKPEEAEALSLKGLVLCMLSRFNEAEPLLRQAVTIEPEQVSFWLNLAECLRQTHRHEQACELLTKHIPSSSTIKAAWIGLYQSAISAQKVDPAIYALEKLLNIDLDIKVLLSLANLYVKRQELQKATSMLLNVIAQCGKTDEVWNALCWLLREQGRWSELYQYVSRWIELAPNKKEALKIKAMVCYELGLQHDAISTYEHIFTLADSDDDDWLSYVEICVQTLELKKAKTAIERLRNKGIVTAELLNAQTLLAIYAGDKEQGLILSQQCLQQFPHYLPIYSQYSNLTRGELLAQQVKFLQSCMQSKKVPKQEKTMLAFVLAHDANAKRNYDLAFTLYTNANVLMSEMNMSRGTGYQQDVAEQRIKNIMLNFKQLRPLQGDFDNQNLTPIFIVGMPRSGTTLLEGGIAAHPDIHMGGERIELPNLLSKILREQPDKDQSSRLLADFTAQYLLKGKTHNLKFITDKNPTNYESIGLISVLFPKSLIINIERDPVETCFSIFRHEFNHLWPYSTSLTDIAHQYKQYQELIRFWRQQPINLVTIKYEELTANFEHKISSIQQKIGIAKSTNDPQKKFSQHNFTTLSALQVRETVQNQNGLVEYYGAHLEGLRKALNFT